MHHHRPGATARRSAPAAGDERGAVTAEAAMALPVLVLFTLAMAWLVSLGVTQVRALDAAREVARAAARSDSAGEAAALGRRVAPAGSRVSVEVGEDLVVARVSAPVRGPGGLFGALGSHTVEAEAVAAAEPGS
ncbi:TadE family type IV pilus minor pilin [Nocardioides aurantiacus]|uniref:TadE-like protein n=1 Tax=Nocardioides aurantiacus TaxID=86796 RepID=A0A3N2CP96_9ACTN|nr:TadE family type IV pilus minor pilin [Nocardioides aurantiacus]ROR89343.1 TadE-like protein [Nocardioides aurantiacus]